MENWLAVIAALFYLGCLATIIPGLLHQEGISKKNVLVSIAIALFSHAALLSHDILQGNGQDFSILNVASLMSFIIALVMSIAMFKTRLWFLLPIVYSFAAINALASTFINGHFITHLENSPEVLVHISLALFAYATLTIGALYALQLAWLDKKLKEKKALAINPNLPPLLTIERQLFNIIAMGTGLLTVTLLTGFIFVGDMFAEGKAHKAIFSIIAWIIYVISLWGHYQKGWRGRKITWFAVAGAGLLTLAYFGSRFVKEVILG
ncbi:inner membrane protein YpjD [Vibrio sp.]|nr:inner membrane protein YpjD [Vibrio sp.]